MTFPHAAHGAAALAPRPSVISGVAFFEKLRTRWTARRHAHDEEEEEQLAAEARGEAAAIHGRRDLVRDQRYREDYPSRGGGVVGR